jgi:hypothetical protein
MTDQTAEQTAATEQTVNADPAAAAEPTEPVRIEDAPQPADADASPAEDEPRTAFNFEATLRSNRERFGYLFPDEVQSGARVAA